MFQSRAELDYLNAKRQFSDDYGYLAEGSLKKVINVLYDRKILEDRSDRKKMQEIRDLGNAFIHRGFSLKVNQEIVEKVNASTQDIISRVGLVKYKYDKSVS